MVETMNTNPRMKLSMIKDDNNKNLQGKTINKIWKTQLKIQETKNIKNNTTFNKWQFLGKTIKIWQGKIKLIQIW